MAESGDGDIISSKEQKEVRRLQELFHGRFSENDAATLYKHCNKNLLEAVDFVLKGEPIQIRNITEEGVNEAEQAFLVQRQKREEDEERRIRYDEEEAVKQQSLRDKDDSESQTVTSRIDTARLNSNISEVLKGDIPAQLRQFGCERCDNMWWRRVPSRKMVSKCKLCWQKYEAIPRENEYGWAKHTCNNCGNEFHGFGAMNRTRSPCYNCGNMCTPVEVVPPFQRRRTRTRTEHSCTASNCYNRSPYADRSGVVINLCVHPLSMGRKVLNPSQTHVSTGSTVNTFLDQDDLENFCQYEPSLASITESTYENDSSD